MMSKTAQLKMPVALVISITVLSISWLTSGALFPTRLASDGAIMDKDPIKIEQYMGPILFGLVVAFAAFITLAGFVEIKSERIRTVFGRKVSQAASSMQADIASEENRCENSLDEIERDLETIHKMKNELNDRI
jgi:hypothetical protein